MENENRNPDEDKVPEEFKEPEPYAIYKEALSHLEGFTSSSPKTTNSLVESIRQNLEKNPGEVYNILKRASKNELSPIASRKGRGGGYYLAPIQSRSEKAESTVDLQAEAEKSARTLERHLWPLINLWLREEKEIQNTSYKIAHKKGGGTWGNPDVVALRPTDKFGLFDVEITTVEVKQSLSNWRYYFFEAVSHKRFSERVYFAYRSDGSKTGDEKELVSYAEKYGVGIVRMELDDVHYSSLSYEGGLATTAQYELLDKFVEVIPAPYDPVPIAEKVMLMERLGITERSEIHRFGLYD